jgi:uncharacterized lipoprotein YajG
MTKSTILLLCAALFFAACGEKPAPTSEAPAATEPDLSIVIGEKVGLITSCQLLPRSHIVCLRQ